MLKGLGKSCSKQKKIFFDFGYQIFCEQHHKRSTFRLLWPTSSGPRPKPLGGSILRLGPRPGNMSQNDQKPTSLMTPLTKKPKLKTKNIFFIAD